jgi:hypothetical protein
MLDDVRKYRLMPEEVCSEQNCLADDGTLSKVLVFDIAHQLRCPAGLAFVDADNCYNRIAHPMALMIFQVFWSSDTSYCLTVVNNPENAILSSYRIR